MVGLWGGCVRKIFDTQHLYLLSELVPVDPWQLGYSHHTLESGELGKKHSRAVVSHLTPSPLASENTGGRVDCSGVGKKRAPKLEKVTASQFCE